MNFKEQINAIAKKNPAALQKEADTIMKDIQKNCRKINLMVADGMDKGDPKIQAISNRGVLNSEKYRFIMEKIEHYKAVAEA